MKEDADLCPHLKGMACAIETDQYYERYDHPPCKGICPLACKCPLSGEYPGCSEWEEVFFHMGLIRECEDEDGVQFSAIWDKDTLYIMDGRTLIKRSYDREGAISFETAEAFIEDLMFSRRSEK